MKLGIIVNTNDVETAWNALRLGNEALVGGNQTTMFLLGSGVEMVASSTSPSMSPESSKSFWMVEVIF